MSCWYTIVASKACLTQLEEMVFSTYIHDDGLLISEFNKGVKCLDTYKINYTIIKKKKHPSCDEIWGYFQITDEIPDWEEIYDKIQFQWKWNFNYFTPMYGFLEQEWYNSVDLGDDMDGTPIEARLIDQLIFKDIGNREINDLFIMKFIKKCTDNNISDDNRTFNEIIRYFNKNKGKFVYILN
jgi:hypothetical protein